MFSNSRCGHGTEPDDQRRLADLNALVNYQSLVTPDAGIRPSRNRSCRTAASGIAESG